VYWEVTSNTNPRAGRLPHRSTGMFDLSCCDAAIRSKESVQNPAEMLQYQWLAVHAGSGNPVTIFAELWNRGIGPDDPRASDRVLMQSVV
jgi:hypothetical protein